MSFSRNVPVRYERDFWPSSFERRMPIYHDPAPFGYHNDYRYSYREPLSYDVVPSRPFPVTETRSQTAMDGEMQRMSDEMRRMCDSMSRGMVPAPPSQVMAPVVAPVVCPPPTVDDWRLSENFRMDNPIVQDRDGSRKFYLEFDVSQFKPEEINVKTSGNQLSIQARHDDKDPNRQSYREFSRQYVLPKEVKPEYLTSKLSDRGKLTIEAPLPGLPGARDKLIPIEHRK